MSSIRILLAYDMALQRSALRTLLEAEAGIEIVSEANSTKSVQEQVRQHQPEVVVMSVSARGGMGTSLVKWLTQHHSTCRTVVISPREDASFARSILSAGAAGYVCEQSPASVLLSAIREVAAGRTILDSHVTAGPGSRMVGVGEAGAGIATRRKMTKSFLSKRETDVLKLLARGYTNQQVADALSLSIKTAETYRTRLTRKLGVTSRSELFHYAFEVGLIGPDQLVDQSQNDTEAT